MFNKILSTLPYNPSSIEQLAFYSKRLKQEQSVRRLGLGLIVLSMFIQLFAAAVPPEKSLASSSNSIINGIGTKYDILRAWDAPGSDIPAIYGKFGVSRSDIANLTSRPNTTITSNQHDFWSIGRHSLSGYSGVSDGYKDSEVRLRAGGTHVYMRKLNAWGVASYPAFKGRVASTGKQFWIIKDCGNFTQLGKSTPAPPNLEIRKSVIGGKTTVAPGEDFTWRVEYRNTREDSLAEGVSLHDDLDAGYIDKLSPTYIPMAANGVMIRDIGSLPNTDASRLFDVTVRVKPNIAPGTRICNYAKLYASNATNVTTPKVCVVVQIPVAPTASPPPQAPPQTPPQPEVPPGSTKTVRNVTRSLEGRQAINTTLRPGDVVEYTLITSNSQDTDKQGYQVTDFIGDVLEYATLDNDFLARHGGEYNATTKQVIWSNQTLPANGQLEKKFRVSIKNPIPATNSPTATSTTFDCKISNEYGDEISMKIQCPVLKTVEELPNTGPGTTIGVAFTVAVISSYFFARSRLLSKELDIVKKDYAATGI